MKKLLLALVLLLCSSTIFAQSTIHKSSVFIGLGPSIPTGDFSSTDVSNDKSGLATTGFYLDLGYQYLFTKNLGVLAFYKWKVNGISEDALDYSVPTGSGGSLAVSATSWKVSSTLIGLSQTFALTKNKKLSIEFREVAGVQFTSSPELNVNYSIPGIGSSSAKQESQSSISFAYQLGLGFKYQLNNKLQMRMFGDFNNSNASFKEYSITTGGNTVTAPASKQKTGTIDVGLGLAFGL